MPRNSYIRVKDNETGHEYDLPETDWRIRDGLVTPIKADRYPPAKTPRRSKPRKPLGGKPVVEPPAGEPATPTDETGENKEA